MKTRSLHNGFLPPAALAIVAALVAPGWRMGAAAPAAPPRTIHLEAEAATLAGPSTATARKGYSGAGYVIGFQKAGDRIVWSLPRAKAGIYAVKIRYSAPSGEKGYDLVVNGSKSSGMFARTGDVFATHVAGKVELRSGSNTVAIERGWGYYDIDALDLVPATVGALKKPGKVLCNPRASAKARALMSDLVDRYGRETLSGQYQQKDTDYIRAITGKTPAFFGGDLIEYSPSRVAFGARPGNYTEQIIENARGGQIITLLWHWNAPSGLRNRTYVDANGKRVEAPWWRGFYTDATTFDLQKALANPRSEDGKRLLDDIDVIAAELKKLRDAGIPVLWRPLHEAEGGWFWWGAKGPEPFKRLWRLMVDRLTRRHSLHNLIWVYSSGTRPEWYPGDAYVDIVGIDAYPTDPGDPLSGTWETLDRQYGGKKLLALTEFGGVPDVEKMRRFGVRWSFFVSWVGDLGPAKMPKETLSRIYRSKAVITRDEVRFRK